MAIPAGFEPATLCLEGRCSIQLSYGILGAVYTRKWPAYESPLFNAGAGARWAFRTWICGLFAYQKAKFSGPVFALADRHMR